MASPKGGGGRCKNCERLREENRILKKELTELRERLESLESSAVRCGWYKPSVKPSLEKKKPGNKTGHLGFGRRKPDHVDEVVAVELDNCPPL